MPLDLPRIRSGGTHGGIEVSSRRKSEAAVGVNIHSVHHRLKTYESAVRKSGRLTLSIAEMQDIAGLRVVAATADEVDVVARFFTRRADSHDLTVKSDKRIDKGDAAVAPPSDEAHRVLFKRKVFARKGKWRVLPPEVS